MCRCCSLSIFYTGTHTLPPALWHALFGGMKVTEGRGTAMQEHMVSGWEQFLASVRSAPWMLLALKTQQ